MISCSTFADLPAIPASGAQLDQMRAELKVNYLWPVGTTLKIGFSSRTTIEERNKIKSAVDHHLKPYVNLGWEWDVPTREANIRVDVTPELRLDSQIGRLSSVDDLAPLPNAPVGFEGCSKCSMKLNKTAVSLMSDNGQEGAGPVLHEFGHALGMVHEIQKDDDITWLPEELLFDNPGQSMEWVNSKLLPAVRSGSTNGSSFDKDSMMSYAFMANTNTQGISSKFNEVPSVRDKAWLIQTYGDSKDKMQNEDIDSPGQDTHTLIDIPTDTDTVTSGVRWLLVVGVISLLLGLVLFAYTMYRVFTHKASETHKTTRSASVQTSRF